MDILGHKDYKDKLRKTVQHKRFSLSEFLKCMFN